MNPKKAQQEQTEILAGSIMEGANLLRTGSIDGPVVARGFNELVQVPALGAPFTRQLPERTDIQFEGGLTKRK